VSRPENRKEEIWKERSGEYQDSQDALLVSRQSEESRVLLEEGYWDVGMEEVQEQEMKVSRQIEGLAQLILMQRVSVLTNCNMRRSVSRCVNYEAVLARVGKLDRCRPEANAPAFSYNAGDVLPLGRCVSSLLGRLLSQEIYYVVIMLLMDF